MILNDTRLWARVCCFLVLVFGLSSRAAPFNVAKSDILLHIVTQCVDPSKVDYCANCMLPIVDGACGNVSECKSTNEVWALNKSYAVIRDIKMCGCPAEFIHGLAIPRDLITGVEDVNREEGIWQYAWGIGLERIDPESLALVVNPKSQRTQNQLHVHILRLRENARADFINYPHAYIQNLDHVWGISQRMASSLGLTDYGILITKEAPGQYVIIVSPNSPEAQFTIWNCGK